MVSELHPWSSPPSSCHKTLFPVIFDPPSFLLTHSIISHLWRLTKMEKQSPPLLPARPTRYNCCAKLQWTAVGNPFTFGTISSSTDSCAQAPAVSCVSSDCKRNFSHPKPNTQTMATNPTTPLEFDPNPNPASTPSPYLEDMEEFEKVFNRFDANGNGKIYVDELDSVLRTLGSGMPPEELKRVMDDLNTDRDGFISLHEFAAFCRSDMPNGGDAELRDAFDLYDRDKNGLILQGFQVFHSSGMVESKTVGTFSPLQKQENQRGFFVDRVAAAATIINPKGFNSDVISHISRGLQGASIFDIKKTQNYKDLLVEVSSGENVKEVQPQMDAIAKCPGRGIIVLGSNSPGSGFDFYSRFFCPKFRVNEDPVTGTAHCSLASYWSEKLGSEISMLIWLQVSERNSYAQKMFDEMPQKNVDISLLFLFLLIESFTLFQVDIG